MTALQKSLLFAIIGQGLDLWTTKRGIEAGAAEANPFMRPLVERGRYDIIAGLKTAALIGSVAPYTARPTDRNRKSATTMLCVAGVLGLAAGIWNTAAHRSAKKKASAAIPALKTTS